MDTIVTYNPFEEADRKNWDFSVMPEIEGQPYYIGYMDGANNKVPNNPWDEYPNWDYSRRRYDEGFEVGFEYWKSLNEIVEILK